MLIKSIVYWRRVLLEIPPYPAPEYHYYAHDDQSIYPSILSMHSVIVVFEVTYLMMLFVNLIWVHYFH